MILQNINKETYRKHLNVLIIVGIISLTVLSLGISQTAIFLFTDLEGTHFWLNVSEVVVTLIILSGIFSRYRSHTYCQEVDYVLRLKQQMNYIYRKQKHIEPTLAEGNIDAFIIMSFYYKACQQLYTLDDNTITMSSVVQKANELEALANEHNLNQTPDELAGRYNQALLEKF